MLITKESMINIKVELAVVKKLPEVLKGKTSNIKIIKNGNNTLFS